MTYASCEEWGVTEEMCADFASDSSVDLNCYHQNADELSADLCELRSKPINGDECCIRRKNIAEVVVHVACCAPDFWTPIGTQT